MVRVNVERKTQSSDPHKKIFVLTEGNTGGVGRGDVHHEYCQDMKNKLSSYVQVPGL